jgi:hypothetical protein
MLFDTCGFRDSDAGLIHLISLHCRLARVFCDTAVDLMSGAVCGSYPEFLPPARNPADSVASVAACGAGASEISE